VIGALVLDRGARLCDGGRTLLGGDPPRALRLTDDGAAVLRALIDGAGPDSSASRALARRLIDAGLAHPGPRRAPTGEVTAVVPVRDRVAELERCLAALVAVPGDRPGRLLVVDDGSRDASAVAEVAARHGAELLRRAHPGGPAAARNAALATIDGGLVAFVDCDCLPEAGWLSSLCGALAGDPGLGAVAPRVRPLTAAREGALERFAAARSPLDLGPEPAAVRPGGRVSYVPTAALLARRAALGAGFDAGLRHGEDVDLVWRMHDAGWRIRYEPAATVRHAEPQRLRAWLGRRYRYGTAAGPLARRHPGRLAPLVVHARPAAVVGLLAARRPGLAGLVLAGHTAATTRSLHRLGVSPATVAGLAVRGCAEMAVGVGRAATIVAPGALALGLVHGRAGRARPAVAALGLAGPLHGWLRARPDLDPVRWTALSIADDVAYGAGVWAGAVTARTAAPLLPRGRTLHGQRP
jgi:mycofactocin system glycosyltransferase